MNLKIKKETETQTKWTLQTIVDNLISVSGEILHYRSLIAMGDLGDLDDSSYMPSIQEEILKIATPLIQSFGATRKVEANSASDVITMLSKGKISTKEATTLMALLKSKTEIEEKEIKVNLQKTLLDITGD